MSDPKDEEVHVLHPATRLRCERADRMFQEIVIRSEHTKGNHREDDVTP
jgi:hypothetical protein